MASHALLPVNGTIWVRRDPGAEKAGAIHIPDNLQHPTEVATVVFACETTEFVTGQRIVLGEFSGAKMTIEEEELWVVRADEVVAVFTRDIAYMSQDEYDMIQAAAGEVGGA